MAISCVVRTRDRINRSIRKATATEPEPAIRWNDVVRVDALATDALGPCEVSLTFHYSDGADFTLFVHHRGYDAILAELLAEFPSIQKDWYRQLCKDAPSHAESVLYTA